MRKATWGFEKNRKDVKIWFLKKSQIFTKRQIYSLDEIMQYKYVPDPVNLTSWLFYSINMMTQDQGWRLDKVKWWEDSETTSSLRLGNFITLTLLIHSHSQKIINSIDNKQGSF